MSKVEITIDVRLDGAAGFWIERDAWEAMSDHDKRTRVGEAIDTVALFLATDTINVDGGEDQEFLTVGLLGPETTSLDLADVKVYDPEAETSPPTMLRGHHVDEHGQPVRYVVDGRESEHPEANDAGDGQFPPFQVFDVDTQRHVPIIYVDRATAQTVATALNTTWRASL